MTKIYYEQILIFMYKDIIIYENIVGIYVLMNRKNNLIYEKLFESIYTIVTDNNKINCNVSYIITDNELALMNNIKKIFPKVRHFSCYYHYKKDLLLNIKKYGLYKKKDKSISDIIIGKLGNLPVSYKGNLKYIYQICEEIIKVYPNYTNYINNYFIQYKLNYFKNGDYDYSKIPEDCKSISFVENYNRYMKNILGKKRKTNWFTFLNFLKEESDRSIQKLVDNKNYNIDYKLKKTIFKNKYIDFFEEDNNNNKSNLESITKNKTKELNNNNLKLSNINIKQINEFSFKLVGLLNYENICYLNASLQILIHLYSFMNEINKCENLDNKPFTKGLIDLYNKIYTLADYDFTTANHFKDILDKEHNIYKTGQHDCMELIRILLNHLNIENNRSNNQNTYEECNYTKSNKIDMSIEFHEFYLKKDNSFIIDIFYTQLSYTYTCFVGLIHILSKKF